MAVTATPRVRTEHRAGLLGACALGQTGCPDTATDGLGGPRSAVHLGVPGCPVCEMGARADRTGPLGMRWVTSPRLALGEAVTGGEGAGRAGLTGGGLCRHTGPSPEGPHARLHAPLSPP